MSVGIWELALGGLVVLVALGGLLLLVGQLRKDDRK